MVSKPSIQRRYCFNHIPHPIFVAVRLSEDYAAYKRNLKTPADMASESNDTLTNTESEKSGQSNTSMFTKEYFYDFLKSKISPSDLESIFVDIKKGITFKLDELPNEQRMSECFERVYCKSLTSTRQAKKNWSEDETTLIVCIVTLYCALKQADYTAIVSDSNSELL